MTFEPVGGFAELVEVARHDPWVRWGLPRSAPLRGWYDADADAVAVSRTRRPYGTSLFVLPVGATPLGPRTVTAALAVGSPAVTVDLYADNDAARRVYERLGFVLGREVVSWPL